MSFLDKDGEESQSSFWDWVVGIGLIVIIGGFTAYYQFQKKSSLHSFSTADSLFTKGEFLPAKQHYEKLKTAQYLTSKNDSLIYARLDSIENMQERSKDAAEKAKVALNKGDTVTAQFEAQKIVKGVLAPEELQGLGTVLK